MYKSRIRNAKERNSRSEKSRIVEVPEEGQEYAIVERLLGNGRVEVYCEDGSLKTVRIRGAMRKYKAKVIIENGDLVVIAPWDFEPGKGDLIHKYMHEEVAKLLYDQDLPEKIFKKLNKNAGGDYGLGNTDDGDDEVVFANENNNKSGIHDKYTDSQESKNNNDNDSEEEELDIDAI